MGSYTSCSAGGFFTIHRTDELPIEEEARRLREEKASHHVEEEPKLLVDQVVIPGKPLRTLLKEAGLDHYSLSADLESLSRKLRQRFGWS
jgi:hypothetical protein